MDFIFHSRLPRLFRKDSVAFLAFPWITGLIAGAITSIFAGDSFLPLMRGALYSPVSIVSLLSAMLLPLLFSAFAVYISCQWLLIPVVVAKGFLYAFFCAGILFSFGSAGWLLRLLLIFSDTLMLPVFWMFWLRSLKSGKSGILMRVVPAVSAALLIGSIDHTLISPFLAEILSF